MSRTLGARFAVDFFAIRVVRSVAGNRLSDLVGLRKLTVEPGRTCHCIRLVATNSLFQLPYNFGRQCLLGSFVVATLQVAGVHCPFGLCPWLGRDSLSIAVWVRARLHPLRRHLRRIGRPGFGQAVARCFREPRRIGAGFVFTCQCPPSSPSSHTLPGFGRGRAFSDSTTPP